MPLKPLIISFIVHAVILGGALYGWQQTPQPKRIVMPSVVEAKLVKLKSETKKIQKKKIPKKIDLTKKKPAKAAPKKTAPTKKPIAKPKPKPVKTQAQLNAEKEEKRLEKLRKEQEQQRILAQQEADREAEQQALADAEIEQEAMSYGDAIKRRIEQIWSRPPSARNGMICKLNIQFVPTGRVVNVSIIESSGNNAFDQSAVQAVKRIEVFPEIKEMPSDVFEAFFRHAELTFNPQDRRL